MSELVEHVDEQERVLGVVERGEAERQDWPHRIATTICRDRAGRILVLRRSETHSRFPGYYDVMVGGAVNVGESYEEAAARELSEELGVRVSVRFMFKFLCREGISPVWFGVHEAVVTEPLIPDPGEIAWQGWLTEAELCEVVDQRLFVPGGRKALCRYLQSESGLAAEEASPRRSADVSGDCDAVGMIPWNLLVIDKALRASWAADTCSPDDLARVGWQPGNPAWGHCDITALIVNDIFGGDLMVGEVHCGGEQHGFHWWNRLPSGVDLDLTHEQFRDGQTVTAARVVKRPPGPLPRRWEEYLLLRERVIEHLGHLPEPA